MKPAEDTVVVNGRRIRVRSRRRSCSQPFLRKRTLNMLVGRNIRNARAFIERERRSMEWMEEELAKWERPRQRGDCRCEQRPCPWVGCRYHLYADISFHGTLVMIFPMLELWEIRETCALDVADRGPQTQEKVGEFMNLTRERVRQIEKKALAKLGEGILGAYIEQRVRD